MSDTRIEALEGRVRSLERLLQASTARQPRPGLSDFTLSPITDPSSGVAYALYNNSGNRASITTVAASKMLALYVPGRGAVQFGEIIDDTLRTTLLGSLNQDDIIWARSDNSGSNWLQLGAVNTSTGATYTNGIIFNRPVGWFTESGIFFMGCGLPMNLDEMQGNGMQSQGVFSSAGVKVVVCDTVSGGGSPPYKLRLATLDANWTSPNIVGLRTT